MTRCCGLLRLRHKLFPVLNPMPTDRRFWVGRGIVSAILVVVLLQGCPPGQGSRLAHYRMGGAFFGGGPAVSPDGQYVVFASPRTGNGDIYRVNIDGSQVTQLTSGPDYDCSPAYSPDGAAIVFVREIGSQGQIWIMNADGSDQRPLSVGTGDADAPKFASDQLVVFSRVDPVLARNIGIAKASELWLIDITTNVETRLTDNRIGDESPDASLDGEHFSFTRDFNIWIYDRATLETKMIGKGTQPTFSPDGKMLAVVAGQYGRRIDVMNIDGSGHQTIYSENTTVSAPDFLPDGTGVLFLEHSDGHGVGKVMLLKLENLDVSVVVDTH